MSFEQNYGTYFKPNAECYEEETPITKEELLQMQIEKHIEDEENKLEEIKETYRWLNEK